MDVLMRFYNCNPALNTKCKKTSCQTDCFMTTNPAYRANEKEYIAVNGEFVPVKPEAKVSENITEEQAVTYLHAHNMMAVSKELYHEMYAAYSKAVLYENTQNTKKSIMTIYIKHSTF